jgi:hypothetical protein
MFEGLFQPLHLLLVIGIGVVIILPFWMIFKKAGFSPWLSLFMIFPVLGFIALLYLAFAEWPVNSKERP